MLFRNKTQHCTRRMLRLVKSFSVMFQSCQCFPFLRYSRQWEPWIFLHASFSDFKSSCYYYRNHIHIYIYTHVYIYIYIIFCLWLIISLTNCFVMDLIFQIFLLHWKFLLSHSSWYYIIIFIILIKTSMLWNLLKVFENFASSCLVRALKYRGSF